MRLESEPRANVVVDFAIVPDAEGDFNYASLTITPSSVTFEPTDFGVDKTVDFIIEDDGTFYGDVEFDVRVAFDSPGDVAYATLAPPRLTVTALEGDPAPAWVIADSTGLERIVAAPGETPIEPVRVVERTGTLRYSIRPAGLLWKSVTVEPTFAPGTKQRGVVSPTSHTFAPGDRTPAQFTLRFPSNVQVLGDQDVEVYHVVTGVDDEPGYAALNPALRSVGGAMPVKMIESDTPGFSLGNGVNGVILVEEPRDATSAGRGASVGIALRSKPTGSVRLRVYEATNATNVLNPNATATGQPRTRPTRRTPRRSRRTARTRSRRRIAPSPSPTGRC